jgi:hypothetical protein
VEQTTGTSSQAAATAPSTGDDRQAVASQDQTAQPAGAEPKPPDTAGFGARGRIRRRARFLRKARELAYRDLGGLVYNLHRFGQRNDQLVLAKLTLLGQIDHELRTLEGALGEPQPMTILREAGVTVCARCAAIHSSEDRYCPNCGLSLGRHPDLPIAGAATPGAPAAGAPAPSPPSLEPGPPPAAPASGQTGASPPGTSPAATPAPADPPTAVTTPPGPPPAGRSPTPPSQRPAGSPTPAPPASPSPGPPTRPHRLPGREEDTEIIRPPASGS